MAEEKTVETAVEAVKDENVVSNDTTETVVDENEVDSESTEKATDVSSEDETDEETPEVAETEKVVKAAKNNGRVAIFDKKEAKRFSLDNAGFVKVILYKYVIFAFKFTSNDYDDGLYDTIKESFMEKLHNLIHTLDIADYEEKDMEPEANSVDMYGIYHMCGVFVPATARTNIIINAFNSFIKTENESFNGEIPEMYKVERFMRIKSTAMIEVDASKQLNPESFAKSFVATSRIGSKDKPKADLRAGYFINEDTGWNSKDVSNMNKYILAGSKVNIYSTNENTKLHNDYVYRLNFKSRFNIVINEFISIDEKAKTFKVHQTKIIVSMYLKEMFGKKVPIGIFVTTDEKDIDVEDVRNIYNVDDGKGNAINLIEDLTNIPLSNVAFETFFSDLNSVKENIFDSVSSDDEEVSK